MQALKDIYNQQEISRLADAITSVYAPFQNDTFVASLINDSWAERELKQRIRAVTLSLGEFLPNDYQESLAILRKVHDRFSGLFHLIFPDFVEVYGLDDYEVSLEALQLFTPQCSSEFAIRPFLLRYPHLIERLKEWTKHEDEHIRRLASEGCRPRLPWAMALVEYKENPTRILEVLEFLKDDESLYVRKSVANNLNDISKDNPQIAKTIFKLWYGNSTRTDWIVKHASRTLLKAGDMEVMELFGYSPKGIEVKDLKLDRHVTMDNHLDFSFGIFSPDMLGKVRLEYKLGFMRKNETMGYKVFKISERELKTQEILVKKSHHFRYITTRKYYAGVHTLTIIVNGQEFLTEEFELIIPKLESVEASANKRTGSFIGMLDGKIGDQSYKEMKTEHHETRIN